MTREARRCGPRPGRRRGDMGRGRGVPMPRLTSLVGTSGQLQPAESMPRVCREYVPSGRASIPASSHAVRGPAEGATRGASLVTVAKKLGERFGARSAGVASNAVQKTGRPRAAKRAYCACAGQRVIAVGTCRTHLVCSEGARPVRRWLARASRSHTGARRPVSIRSV